MFFTAWASASTVVPSLAAALVLAARTPAAEALKDGPLADDPILRMQAAAEAAGRASWGHWGDQPDRYVSWSDHSNRLIPVYTFGIGLEAVAGERSIYRDAARLESLYGRLPEATLNPRADRFA